MKKNNRFGPFILLLFLLHGCNVYDLGDLCCTESDVMYFKLEYSGIDYFDEEIHGMRYIVFGEDGKFVRQLYASDGQLNKVKLDSLEFGSYTILAIANLENYGWFIGEAGKGLSALCFVADDFFRDTKALNNGEPLFWGIGSFEKIPGDLNSFVTYLSNVHAVLRVHVDWEGVPKSSSDVYMQLEGVYEGYILNPSLASPIGNQFFPAHIGEKRSTVVQAPLRQMALDARIVSLRYTDSELPELHLWQDGAEIITPINLEHVFGSWGWFADQAQVQEYGISLLIKLDGSVIIRPYTPLGVSDWIDGGTFG